VCAHGHGHFSFVFGLFRIAFGCFGYIETPRQAVSILKRNSRNKHLVSDSAETSFGYIETKLVSFQFWLYRNETSFVGHPTLEPPIPKGWPEMAPSAVFERAGRWITSRCNSPLSRDDWIPSPPSPRSLQRKGYSLTFFGYTQHTAGGGGGVESVHGGAVSKIMLLHGCYQDFKGTVSPD
jgi:hypothetical protein